MKTSPKKPMDPQLPGFMTAGPFSLDSPES